MRCRRLIIRTGITASIVGPIIATTGRYDQGQQVLKQLAAIDRQQLTRDEQIHFDIFRRLQSDRLQEFAVSNSRWSGLEVD